jgi:hypothetical protein
VLQWLVAMNPEVQSHCNLERYDLYSVIPWVRSRNFINIMRIFHLLRSPYLQGYCRCATLAIPVKRSYVKTTLGEVHLKSVHCAGATTVICCQLFAFAHNSGKQHSADLQVWRLWTKYCIFASHFQESKIHLQLRLCSVAPKPIQDVFLLLEGKIFLLRRPPIKTLLTFFSAILGAWLHPSPILSLDSNHQNSAWRSMIP